MKTKRPKSSVRWIEVKGRRVLVVTLTGGVLLALLAGCPSPGLSTGLTGIISQAGYTCNTAQLCERADIATAIADRALPLALAALQESGHAPASAKLDGRKLSVCLVRYPEQCAFGGWHQPPCNPALKTCARKRGCASPWHAWGSVCWPPVCRPEWPDEPHCVTAGKARTAGWDTGLVHELFNLVRQRYAGSHEADYKKLPELFGVGGVESRVMSAYQKGITSSLPEIPDSYCR